MSIEDDKNGKTNGAGGLIPHAKAAHKSCAETCLPCRETLTCDLDFERDGRGRKAAGSRRGGHALDGEDGRLGVLLLFIGGGGAERVREFVAQAHLGADRAVLGREAFVICIDAEVSGGKDEAES